MEGAERMSRFATGDDVRVRQHVATSHPDRRAVIAEKALTGKGSKYKLRFPDGEWGWYSEYEIEADRV